jgi:hypothetical protein
MDVRASGNVCICICEWAVQYAPMLKILYIEISVNECLSTCKECCVNPEVEALENRI